MFVLQKMQNGGLRVTGTDVEGNSGSAVLFSDVMNKVDLLSAEKELVDKFDALVDETFAPFIEIADEMAALQAPSKWAVVTVGEDVQGSQARSFRNDDDGILIRILRETDGSCLRWHDEHTLIALVEV